MSLDVMKYGVATFTLTVMLPIQCIIFIGICYYTDDRGNHHSLGADSTSFGLDFGLKFMDLTPQDSFGPDLKKFKFGEHLFVLVDYEKIKHMIYKWEQ